MEIYALRHGITPLNKLKLPNGQIDEPLAPEGFEQAKEAALLIPGSVKTIYSSSLLRAKQTAEAVNFKRNLPLTFHDELREVDMGSLAGTAWEDMENGLELRKKHIAIQYDYNQFGGETNEEFRSRVLTFLKNVKDNHKTGEVLLITHGGVVRFLTMLEESKELGATKNLSLYTFDLEKILPGK